MTVLNYASRRRRPWIRWALAAFLSATAGVVAWRYTPVFVRNSKLVLLQRSVLKAASHPQQVVCISDFREQFNTEVSDPTLWSRLDGGGMVRNALQPDWIRYQSALGLTPDAVRGSLYVGEIFTPSGERRILALQFPYRYPMIRYSLISAGDIWTSPRLICESSPVVDGKYVLGLLGVSSTYKGIGPMVYSGHFDPSAPTRVTMRMFVGGREATMNLTLDDNDVLTTSLRDPQKLAQMEIDDGEDRTEYDNAFFQSVLTGR